MHVVFLSCRVFLSYVTHRVKLREYQREGACRVRVSCRVRRAVSARRERDTKRDARPGARDAAAGSARPLDGSRRTPHRTSHDAAVSLALSRFGTEHGITLDPHTTWPGSGRRLGNRASERRACLPAKRARSGTAHQTRSYAQLRVQHRATRTYRIMGARVPAMLATYAQRASARDPTHPARHHPQGAHQCAWPLAGRVSLCRCRSRVDR